MENKKNLRLCSMLVVLCFAAVGTCMMYAKAYVSGTYTDLYGSVTYSVSDNAYYAQIVAYNKSSVRRYITASVKDGNWNTIESAARVVGYNTSVVINQANVTPYSTVYSHCTVYNSSSPSSGTAETLYEIIR